MCTPIGQLMTPMLKEEPQWEQFDQLGIGVSLYFKMIKVMIYILCISTLLTFPYLFAFNSGSEADNATGLDKMLGAWSLGNIGQSLDMCVKQDINNCDTVDIRCPDNTEILTLR